MHCSILCEMQLNIYVYLQVKYWSIPNFQYYTKSFACKTFLIIAGIGSLIFTNNLITLKMLKYFFLLFSKV